MPAIFSEKDIQSQLRDLAQEIASDIVAADLPHSQELLGTFVSALALAVADQTRRAERRQKQAEGIAAAKAKGVRFGRERAALPDSFERLRRAWRSGQMSLREAADACGMPKSTFRDAALRAEAASGCAETKYIRTE